MADLHEIYSAAEKLKDDGQDEAAVEMLCNLLQQDESFTLAHLALAVLYGRVGDHGKAIQHGDRACQLEPDEPFNFTAMSVTYQRASQAVDNADDNQRFIRLAEEAMARAHQLQAGI